MSDNTRYAVRRMVDGFFKNWVADGRGVMTYTERKDAERFAARLTLAESQALVTYQADEYREAN